MIILSQTTDKIDVVLGGAVTTNELRCFSAYRDITTTGYSPLRNVTLTNGTTDVALVSSPASSTQRVIDTLIIYNADTVTADVTIKLDANGTEYILFKGSIPTGGQLQYNDKIGFKVLGDTGEEYVSINQGTLPVGNTLQSTIITSNVVNSGAANNIIDITGLSFSVTAGQSYWFRFQIQYDVNLITTGSRFSVNGPAGTMSYYSIYSNNTTTVINNQGISAVDTPATSSTNSGNLTNIAIVEGYYYPTSNGTVIGRFASELLTANSAIVKAGSLVQYLRIF